MPDEYVFSGRSANGPRPAKARTSAMRASTYPSGKPSRAAVSTAFWRPVRSGLKPVPSSSRERTVPSTAAVPAVGDRVRLRILSSVDLPAPFGPMTPTHSALGDGERDVAEGPEVGVAVRPAERQPLDEPAPPAGVELEPLGQAGDADGGGHGAGRAFPFGGLAGHGGRQARSRSTPRFTGTTTATATEKPCRRRFSRRGAQMHADKSVGIRLHPWLDRLVCLEAVSGWRRADWQTSEARLISRPGHPRPAVAGQRL